MIMDLTNTRNSRILAVIMGLSMVALLVLFVYFVQDAVYKSDPNQSQKYTYNMTKQEQFDLMVTDICMELQITNPTCSMVYGGIETGNGEPIK